MNVPFAALAMAVSDEKPVSVKSPEVIIMPLREKRHDRRILSGSFLKTL